jgi:hypothetical protein
MAIREPNRYWAKKWHDCRPTRSDTINPMAAGRLRSLGSSRPAAVAPLSEEEELLRKLRDGSITSDEYYEAFVERSIAHLHGTVSAEQLEDIRECMRAEVETNPVLVKMMRDALEELR